LIPPHIEKELAAVGSGLSDTSGKVLEFQTLTGSKI
jgi:hypothetical protein